MEEKRKCPRLKCIFKVRFPEERELETENFSIGGVFVKTAFADRFDLYETVYLIIYLPVSAGAERPVTVESRVVNLMENGIGVEFLNVNEITEQRLKECYDHLYGLENQS